MLSSIDGALLQVIVYVCDRMTSLVMMLGDIKIVGYYEDDRGYGWLTVLGVMRTSDEN